MEKEKGSHIQSSGQNQHLRALWHDYRGHGFYMLTMVTESRVKAFGKLMGDSEDTAHVNLNLLGNEVDRCIRSISCCYPEIEVIDYVVMEDHCHICLEVKREMAKHLGAVVGMIKTATTKAWLHEMNMKKHSLHVIIPKVERDRQRQRDRIVSAMKANGIRAYDNITPRKYEPSPLIEEVRLIVRDSIEHGGGDVGNVGYGSAISSVSGVSGISSGDGESGRVLEDLPVVTLSPLWAEGYHDRIVKRRRQIARVKAYIRRNPARLWLKRHADRAFTQVRDIRIPLSFELAMKLKTTAEQWDMHREVMHSQFSQHKDGSHYAETYVELVQRFLRKNRDVNANLNANNIPPSPANHNPSPAPYIRCRACGNTNLLFSGRPLVRVRLSRSIVEMQFREEAERLLDLCEREGAVLVSPWRSWSEKELLKLVRMNGYEHIVIHGEAMSHVWKPQDGSICNHNQYVPAWWKPLSCPDADIDLAYEGKVLFLALWPDRPRGEKACKADCEIMNEVCSVMELAVGDE